MKKLMFACALATAGAVYADQTVLSVKTKGEFSTNYGTTTLSAETDKQATMPSDLPTPIFWFDCNQRDGWEYETVNGTNFVIKIPSLVGDGRFLTTNVTLEGTSWAPYKPNPPALLEFADLPGGPALDFGPNHSYQGMVFSPKDNSNDLTGIGSIVAIWGSANGGGYILGGGSAANQYFWCRGWENALHTSGSVDHTYWSTVIGDYAGDLNSGFFMSDAFMAPGEAVGLNGTWEVAALQGSTTMRVSAGLGIGDTRSGYNRNGGCRFGEMLIFGEQLTEDQLRRLSVYLKTKWFGRGTKGWNGDANLGHYRMIPKEGTFAQLVDVAAGEKLTIQKVQGGHLGGYGTVKTAIEKSGEGTLAIQDASTFTAPVKLSAGTLELGVKPDVTGTTNDLPFGVFARFDASEKSSMVLSNDTETGRQYITCMKNLGFGKYFTKEITLRPPTCQYRSLCPWLIEASYGSKLPLVYCSHRDYTTARYFNFYSENGDGTYARNELRNVATVFAAVSLNYGGGHLGTGILQRSNRWVGDDSYASQILNSTTAGSAKINSTNSVVWIDGKRMEATSGYPDRGMHVVAIQMPAHNVSTIGAENHYCGTAKEATGAYGGVILGELVIYNRYLNDDEMVKAQAYLMKKWIGRSAPQYEDDQKADIPQVQEVRIEKAGTTIDVPAGKTARVGKLTSDYPVTKTGAGKLLLGPKSDTTLLTVAEGNVGIVRTTPTIEDCTVAKGASLHLDASDPNTMDLVERSGTKYVRCWYSKGTPNHVFQTATANQPFVNETDLFDDVATVDFGNGKDNAYWMRMSTELSVRSVFMVSGSQNGGSQILGEYYNSPERNSVDFNRAGYALDKPFVGKGAADVVYYGEFYHDGVKTNAYQALPKGTWEQIDLHTTAGANASALATSRGNTDGKRGCVRIAELIVYERELSDREKVATRNYLTKKWFPGRELAELPPEEEVTAAAKILTLDVTEDTALDLTESLEAQRMTGSETLVKAGDAKLVIDDFNTFDGTIDVQAGTLEIGASPKAEPALKEEGRVVHFDATYGLDVVTNADDSITISKWTDRMGNRTAEPRGSSKAVLMPWGTKGKPAVDMPSGVSLWWKKDDAYQSVTNIGSVFWVIGSQNGGGFVLGGGAQGQGVDLHDEDAQPKYDWYAWHRGTPNQGLGAGCHTDPIICGSGYGVIGGGFRLNGTKVTDSTGLSGGWDQMTWLAPTNAQGEAYRVAAAGFAFDGREYRYGCQRLAEVIVYDHRLTDEEVAGVEAYLDAKWGFTQSSVENDVAVRLAEGTTLVTTGDQYVDALGGEGTVDGSVTVKEFLTDGASEGFAVTNVLTIAENPKFTFDNLPQVDAKVTITVAEAFAFAGTENLAAATFDGLPEKCRAKVKVEDNKLIVTVKPIRGFVLIIQ